ncbi:MAG: hypothetical protein ABIL09_19870 [Gemmatimonadota bacterium]
MTGIAVLAAAALVAAALWGVDNVYPLGRAWRQAVAALVEVAPQDGARAAVPQPVEPPAAAGATATDPPPASHTSRLPRVGPEPSELPRQGTACARALGAAGRLPGAIRVTSVSSRADGHYMLEGLAPAAQVDELLRSIDTLAALPSQVSLSYWRSGTLAAGPFYQFTFEGRLPEQAGLPLGQLQPGEVAAVLAEVSARARNSGLDSVRVLAAPGTAVPADPDAATGVAVRHKCWATGSLPEINAFSGELAGLRARVSVGEMVVVALGAGADPGGDRAQLYAALDLVVAPPGSDAPGH